MIYALTATTRTGRVVDTRTAKMVPGVVYGKGIASRNIAVPRSDCVRILSSAGSSSLIDVSIDGLGAIKVLVKEVQRDVLSLDPIHVDFYQVNMQVAIKARVPLTFIGESAAIKNLGGTLVRSLDEVEVECLPGNLPHEITVDLNALATFEDAISVANLIVPTGVELTLDRTVTVATVSAPMTEEQLKKLESTEAADIATIKTEGEEKRAVEEAAKAAEDKDKKDDKK